jgi:hypothetical protein
MKKTYTNEEVWGIENSAYEFGVSLGKTISRASIKYAIQKEIYLNQKELDKIKEDLLAPGLSDEETNDLTNEKNNTFLYIVGMNTALRLIDNVEQ